ncbi:hypothetical protein [Streptomyces coffeae]|uniref:ESX-1 secretion-associated protein n=1 Tax=Streptomyces coffeae TaxID=621382 RepID=A0ABS1NKH1_9ACTN|nr:hypothetical protein [Streptomyces coffeae]MBL1100611.1 hypothetical protein [Streptomyces coffeae]
MTNTQTVTADEQTIPTGSGALVTTVPMEETANWPTAAHLSPLAAFQADRVGICTSYQLAAVDHSTAVAHIEAALRHVRAAADAAGVKDDQARMVTTLRATQSELYRVARKVGFSHPL